MSAMIIYCRVCGESGIGPTVEINKYQYCQSCHHDHTDTHRLYYCSLKCIQEELNDSAKKELLDREIAAFHEGTLQKFYSDRSKEINPPEPNINVIDPLTVPLKERAKFKKS